MKILLVIQTMDSRSGGPCAGIQNFVPELKKLNVTHEVVCTDDVSSKFVPVSPFTIHKLGGRNRLGYYNKNLIPWLQENICNYDLVVVHALWGYHGYAVNKVLKQLKRKKDCKCPGYLVMPHGMLDPYFQQAKHRKLKALRNIIYWNLIEQKVINQSEGLLFTCLEEQHLAKDTFKGYSPKREMNIGYGIYPPPPDTILSREIFYKKVITWRERKPYFLFLGRIDIKKGLEILIDAYLELLTSSGIAIETIPDIVISGPGYDTPYGRNLKHKIDSDKLLANKVQFTGMLTGDAKWGAFYGCEAFVLASHQENFGISVGEALACKKPVLISNKVNIYKEIQNSNAGLVEEDNVNGAYNLLYKWLKLTKEEQEKMCENAMTCYKENFHIHHTAELLKGVYEELLA